MTGVKIQKSHTTKLKYLVILLFFFLKRTCFNPVQQIPHGAYWTSTYYSSLKADALNYGIEIFNFKTHKQQTPTAVGYPKTRD